MLVRRLRRWPNIVPALGERLVFAGMGPWAKTSNNIDTWWKSGDSPSSFSIV